VGPPRLLDTPSAPLQHGRALHLEADIPYSKFEKGNLILRDELAIDRTLLANERTLLAYLRSGVALVIAGVSIYHFSGGGWFAWVGVACVPAGLCTGAIGLIRFRRMNRAITRIRMKAESPAEPPSDPGG